MNIEFDINLCHERHQNIDRRLESNEKNIAEVAKAINGKFSKIVGMFIGVLFTIIGSLVVFIISR